ncbi:MAG TPA: hypothetical protein VK158_05955 [Acidobacteriota bacterium]|nr:hypothetical protein [Acidobacteriota bacterium]
MIRKTTVFERFLLIIGIAIVATGIFFVRRMLVVTRGEITTDVLIGIVLWLLLVFTLIIAAIAENAREELGVIMQENSQQIKLLRDISKEQMQELKLLRQELIDTRKK